jgi:T-complex protein 1 subunit gamma
MLQLEEESIHAMCQDIIAVKPDVVVTEKGISGKSKSIKTFLDNHFLY